MKLLIIAMMFSILSCAQSKGDKVKDQVAQDLGIDVKELENKSYYSYTVKGGTLSGKRFNSPFDVPTARGHKYDGKGKLIRSSVTFVDPDQGNSEVEIKWNDDETASMSPNQGTYDGTYLEFKSKINDNNYHFISVSGTTKVVSYKNIEEENTFMNRIEIKKNVNMSFEGLFRERDTGEEVTITGIVQLVTQ